MWKIVIEKAKPVKNFPQPENVQDVQEFLGLPEYFRKFIENCSGIARPLTNLLRKYVVFHFGF